MGAESLLGCFMPLPQCLLVSSFLKPGTFFSDSVCSGAIYHLLLIVCAILKVYILLCVWVCMCHGDHVATRHFLVDSGSLVSAVLCSSWPVSIPVQFFTGLLGLDHCIWLYTWLTEFELWPSGCEAAIYLPLIYFTLDMGPYYVS